MVTELLSHGLREHTTLSLSDSISVQVGSQLQYHKAHVYDEM